MDYTNDYERVENLLKTYKLQITSSVDASKEGFEISVEESVAEKSQVLGELLTALRPLIISTSRYYFGRVDEDLVQDGYEETIRLINKYDDKRTDVKFLGYIKRMLMCFYWGKKRRDLARGESCISLDTVGEVPVRDNTSILELEDILNTLNPKEKALVISVYFESNTLKTATKDMGISYQYGKELMAKAKAKLRSQISF